MTNESDILNFIHTIVCHFNVSWKKYNKIWISDISFVVDTTSTYRYMYRKKTISKAPIRRYRQYRYRRYITIVSPLIYCNENQKQVRQQDAYRQTRRVQLKLSLCTQHPVPLFKGNISVAHCMSLSTRLKGSRMMSPSNILRPPVTLTFD